MGKELAPEKVYGDWYSSFANVFRFKAQIKELCPGSLVVIDHHTINEKKIRFRRFFCALKPCKRSSLMGAGYVWQ